MWQTILGGTLLARVRRTGTVEQAPGNERLVVDYLAGVLTREGIPFEIRTVDPAPAT